MRGALTFLAFDRNTGRFDLSKSFQIEVPPYVQDLSTISWGPGDGLAFVNSFGTEGMAVTKWRSWQTPSWKWREVR